MSATRKYRSDADGPTPSGRLSINLVPPSADCYPRPFTYLYTMSVYRTHAVADKRLVGGLDVRNPKVQKRRGWSHALRPAQHQPRPPEAEERETGRIEQERNAQHVAIERRGPFDVFDGDGDLSHIGQSCARELLVATCPPPTT